MRRDEALAILRAHKDDYARFHVKSLAPFGSGARDEAGPESDIDILVEFDGSPVGIFGFVDFRDYLEQILGRRVDLAMIKAVHTDIRKRIEQKAIRAA
ncbi:MAG TPA: nucleotidyltransferase family protein [Thermomicrobiales bacterium]|nr:nucleotidyltransferase family protein [Thermomicrobiales bacterium]